MDELVIEGDEAYIKSEFNETERFNLKSPTQVLRAGVAENGKGVYKLVYLLKEITK